MTAGEPMNWCQYCGGFFRYGVAHACAGGARFYTHHPLPPVYGGAYVTPLMTEERVRQIVREELERAKPPLPSEGEMRKEMEE